MLKKVDGASTATSYIQNAPSIYTIFLSSFRLSLYRLRFHCNAKDRTKHKNQKVKMCTQLEIRTFFTKRKT